MIAKRLSQNQDLQSQDLQNQVEGFMGPTNIPERNSISNVLHGMRSILCVLLVGGVSASAALADNWSKHWSVSGTPELRVEAGDGRVEIEPGSGRVVEATVTTTGWKIGPGEVTVTEHQDGNRITLDIGVPKSHFSLSRQSQRSIKVVLRVPRDVNSFVHTGDGDIHINGVHGKTEARTGDGSIEALGVDGTFEAHTGDGNVQLRGRLDNLNVDTGDGNIEADLSAGSQMGSGWRMHTGDGQVTVRLPADLRANVDAHSGDGDVTVELPITRESDASRHNEVRGKLNGGGGILNIRTGDGTIRIERS